MLISIFPEECVSPIKFVRESAARALDDLVQLYPKQIETYLNLLEKVDFQILIHNEGQFERVVATQNSIGFIGEKIFFFRYFICKRREIATTFPDCLVKY